MKLFLAAVLLVAAVEAASLGGDPCTWGPSYWCGSVQTARSCRAFPHCLKRVWSKPSLQPVHLTKECLLSQKLVKTMRHLLSMDKGHTEATYLLGSMCSFVDDDALRKECKTLVTDFMPEIFKLIDSDMEPSSVMTVLGLCKPKEEKATGKVKKPNMQNIVAMDQSQVSGKPEGKGKSAEKKVGASVECETCKFVVTAVDDLLTLNATEEAIQNALDDICQRLPLNISVQCKSFVDEYAAVVVALLVQELDPQQVCLDLKLCQPSEAELASPSESKEEEASEAGCLLCDLVVDEIVDMINNKQSEDKMESAMDKFCKDLPSFLSADCQSLVAKYTPAIVKMLKQEIEAAHICKELRLCASSEGKAERTALSARAGSACPVCEIVIGELETLLQNNKTEKAIEEALDKVCSLLPSSISAECTSIINVYAPAIIDLLVQEVPPQKVCATIGLCSSSLKVKLALQKRKRVGAKLAGVVECDVCKLVFSEIKTLLGNDQTQGEIIQAVEKVCEVVGGDLRLQCQSEVKNYGPAVLDLLQHMDDPTQLCGDLHLCTATHSAAKSLPQGKKMMVGTEECTFGPSFWCASMENARKCGMEQECMQKYGLKP